MLGLVGKPEGKRPLGRPRNAWVDDTKLDLKESGCQVGELLHLAVGRNAWWSVVNAAVNLRIPKRMGNFLTSWGTVCS
jgi:hypothetical protein